MQSNVTGVKLIRCATQCQFTLCRPRARCSCRLGPADVIKIEHAESAVTANACLVNGSPVRAIRARSSFSPLVEGPHRRKRMSGSALEKPESRELLDR